MTACSLTASAGPIQPEVTWYLSELVSDLQPAGVIPQQIVTLALFQMVCRPTEAH